MRAEYLKLPPKRSHTPANKTLQYSRKLLQPAFILQHYPNQSELNALSNCQPNTSRLKQQKITPLNPNGLGPSSVPPPKLTCLQPRPRWCTPSSLSASRPPCFRNWTTRSSGAVFTFRRPRFALATEHGVRLSVCRIGGTLSNGLPFVVIYGVCKHSRR